MMAEGKIEMLVKCSALSYCLFESESSNCSTNTEQANVVMSSICAPECRQAVSERECLRHEKEIHAILCMCQR